jgi:hypothetical protein
MSEAAKASGPIIRQGAGERANHPPRGRRQRPLVAQDSRDPGAAREWIADPIISSLDATLTGQSYYGLERLSNQDRRKSQYQPSPKGQKRTLFTAPLYVWSTPESGHLNVRAAGRIYELTP